MAFSKDSVDCASAQPRLKACDTLLALLHRTHNRQQYYPGSRGLQAIVGNSTFAA